MTNLLIQAQADATTQIDCPVMGPTQDLKNVDVTPTKVGSPREGKRYVVHALEGMAAPRWTADVVLRAIKGFISSNVGAVTEVVRVLANVDDDDIVRIHTVLDCECREARYRVYDFEQQIVAAFSEVLFDFAVINLRNFPGASLDDVSQPDDSILYDKVRGDSNDQVQTLVYDLSEDDLYLYWPRIVHDDTSNIILNLHRSFTDELTGGNWYANTGDIVHYDTSNVAFD